MPKYNAVLGSDNEVPPRGARFGWFVLLVILVLVAPVAYEGCLTVYGQWQDQFGTHFEVRTPVLEGIKNGWRNVLNEIQYRTPYTLRANLWTPKVAVPGVIILAGLASLLLRHGH